MLNAAGFPWNFAWWLPTLSRRPHAFTVGAGTRYHLGVLFELGLPVILYIVFLARVD